MMMTMILMKKMIQSLITGIQVLPINETIMNAITVVNMPVHQEQAVQDISHIATARVVKLLLVVHHHEVQLPQVHLLVIVIQLTAVTVIQVLHLIRLIRGILIAAPVIPTQVRKPVT